MDLTELDIDTLDKAIYYLRETLNDRCVIDLLGPENTANAQEIMDSLVRIQRPGRTPRK